MNEERELKRHSRIIDLINTAKLKEDLPYISLTSITSYLASNVYFNKQKISQSAFKPIVDEIINHGLITHPRVKEVFINTLKKYYPNISEEEIINKYNEITKSNRITYILNEIGLKNEKIYEITKLQNLSNHRDTLKEIKNAYDVKDLPKVGIGELNKRILKAVNDNDFNKKIKTSDIKNLTKAYLLNKNYKDIESIIKELCSKENISNEDKNLMKEQILGSLIMDETIEYAVEEIQAKEARKLFIYKNDHEYTMDTIKNAHRISQLPPNLTVSTLNSYLLGNSTIYSNDNRIKSEDLKKLTELLLLGNKWETDIIKNEVRNIVQNIYPEYDSAYTLLFNKLSKLPKTYYYVEEINYSLERQKEFIGNSCSNVNVYFIPNDKSPVEGGKFYNCYINRVQNLDLAELLPLNLNEIVPPSMDIDSIEWYIQENYDDTFKTAGGIILNKDETIGNVNVFKPNDGKIGITIEEKAKMDEISDLDKQIQDKTNILQEIDTKIINQQQKSSETEERIKQLLQTYELKALQLQKELLNSISNLKNELGYSDDIRVKKLNK